MPITTTQSSYPKPTKPEPLTSFLSDFFILIFIKPLHPYSMPM
jgi:hypothetical protein